MYNLLKKNNCIFYNFYEDVLLKIKNLTSTINSKIEVNHIIKLKITYHFLQEIVGF